MLMELNVKNARDENFLLRSRLFLRFESIVDSVSSFDFFCLSYPNDSYLLMENKDSSFLLEDLMSDFIVSRFFLRLDQTKSYLLRSSPWSLMDENHENVLLDDSIKDRLDQIRKANSNFGGSLNEKGEHVIDLKCENVSPHYDVNLLLGNRIGFSYPLQSTPKSVVNRFFQGSFRAHSSYQVLATTWGLRPEENGFMANRQFYLLEDGKQIFYSAKIDDSVLEATCLHKVNHSEILYRLSIGLKIKREIFILPQKEGIPDAVEVQMISIKNESDKKRNLSIVYTGMFGFSNPHCQEEDVIYSTLISQAQVIQNEKREIVAITPDYYPEYFKREMRFCILRDDDSFSTSFTSNYTSFIGRGSLESPEHLYPLDDFLSMKGPSFFGLGKDFVLMPGETECLDTFTGVVDARKTTGDDHLAILKEELNHLLSLYPNRKSVLHALENMNKEMKRYSSFLQVKKADDSFFESYVNRNLPFQVLYQTFVSRSFALTQKGYREIGFREIQDLYASMYYLYASGKKKTIESLLSQWIENVYSFGYANHNFFYVGKEPGMCSDDSLWLVFALSRYLDLSGDDSFLDRRFVMADRKKKRSVYETLKAILLYSGEISIGKHSLPLLDCADWNDCLRIDPDYLDGVKKEKAYRRQILKKKQKFGVPFENEYSESVMNGFLLVIAIKEMMKIAKRRNDVVYSEKLSSLLKEKVDSLQRHAYIEGYFARVLLNRDNKNHISYIGSRQDHLSLEKDCPGSYYLNSFSWSLLSDVASEEQIEEMLVNVVDKYLKTEAGYRLCTSHDLSLAGAKSSSTDHYFVGDRENGGVFKHATMMFARALLYRAKTIQNVELKKKMVEDAYFMLDRVYPYETLKNVSLYKGNPRFCTQYNNSHTNENIGPMLSGTASWLTLTLMEAFGIQLEGQKLSFVPMLDLKTSSLSFELRFLNAIYDVTIEKKEGEVCDEKKKKVFFDGKEVTLPIDLSNEKAKHEIRITYF